MSDPLAMAITWRQSHISYRRATAALSPENAMNTKKCQERDGDSLPANVADTVSGAKFAPTDPP